MKLIRANHKLFFVFFLLSFVFLIFCHLSYCSPLYEDSQHYKKIRYKMVNKQIAARGIYDQKVLQAMRDVPRHLFVPERRRRSAYGDFPLPIGYGQTISQPYIVALMTELLKPEKDDIALEVGTGSGYQAAVLSKIVKKVYTVEIIIPLGKDAEKRLNEMGYKNITVKVGDGYFGWKQYAPFDCIIVTAASDHIPPPLIKQLKNGGKMAIPVGMPFQVQKLMVVEKSEKGEIGIKNILPVRFVPLRRVQR
ncbi:MAG: protein-L-isoaspartate(D-aspartate) O-methyltransferase [Deltaproteobacteria bacterium]|nr:protein-L-isoaspartate(D-aspartate) O-methyltransferase [Deltaproteobacteria bacterium]